MTTQFSPTTSVTINMGSQTTTWQQLAQNCQNSVKDCQLLYFFVRAFNSGFHQKSQLCSPNQAHKTPRFQPGHLKLLMTTASIPAHPVLHCNASPLPPLPLSLCHMQLILAAIKKLSSILASVFFPNCVVFIYFLRVWWMKNTNGKIIAPYPVTRFRVFTYFTVNFQTLCSRIRHTEKYTYHKCKTQ